MSIYQLETTSPVNVGDIVLIDGPWDTYGRVVKTARQRGDKYNTIFGIGHKLPFSSKIMIKNITMCLWS